MKKSNYLTKKSTNWTLRLLSWPTLEWGIIRHTFALHAARKMKKCDHFGGSSTPFPPRINVGSCDYDRIYASVSTFQHWLGGEGVGDHFFAFMWNDASMMSSFFVAFLSVKTIKKVFEFLNYFPQKRTLWRGQSLSSPIRRRFSDPPNAANRWMQQCARFLWCFMLFSTLKPGGWGSPDRSAAVWYRCTGSFCFNPSGQSQYMMPSSTSVLIKNHRSAFEASQKRLWGASEARLRAAKFDEFRKTVSNLTENGAKNHRKREKLLSFCERKFSQSTVNSQQLKRNMDISL